VINDILDFSKVEAGKLELDHVNFHLRDDLGDAMKALAIRARQIVSPAGRRDLAQHWIHVLDLAVRPPTPLPLHGPLCRGAVVAAEPDVREMIDVLAGGLPIAARGAAIASLLLSDGTGPLHNRHSPLELSAAVQEATRQMGSSANTREAPLIR